MTKIVINRSSSGFEPSHEAMMLYAELKGITVYPELQGRFYSRYNYFLTSEGDDRQQLFYWEIDRDDKCLVKAVEHLGHNAGHNSSNLKVVEIPDDVDWVISYYDGYEEVTEVHRTWN